MSHASDILPAPGGTLTEATVSTPRYLNPLLCDYGTVDEDVARLAFAGLTRRTPAGVILPDLAAKWDVGPDLLSYTFTLRPDLHFHDGQPLRVADVVATIAMIQSAGFTGPVGLADVWRGIRVELPAEGQIRLLLREPDATLLEAAALGIVPERWVREVGDKDPRASLFNARPIGAGPFAVVAADRGRVRLEQFAGYHGLRPFLRGVEFAVQADQPAVETAIASGAALTGRLSQPQSVLDEPDLGRTIINAPMSGHLTALVLNTRSAPLTDPSVRRAIAQAIDPRSASTSTLGANGVPASGPICPTSWAYSPAAQRTRYDLAASRALLDATGWAGDASGRQREGKPLEIAITASSDEHVRAAEAVSAQVRRVGIVARVRQLKWTEYVQQSLAKRDFQAIIVTYTTSSADPALYGLYHSSQIESGLNFGGWVSQRADPLLDTARRELAPEARARAYAEFEGVFAEECPTIPLYWPLLRYAVDPRLSGVELGQIVRPSDRLAGVGRWHLAAQRAPVAV